MLVKSMRMYVAFTRDWTFGEVSTQEISKRSCCGDSASRSHFYGEGIRRLLQFKSLLFGHGGV
ncbi:hypothetical protein VN12_16735 [Pirellula sp. SH-Sr6A]|nr:hypothetical protein VN12_16735 [Pirellula sp. SH-Sr6A]